MKTRILNLLIVSSLIALLIFLYFYSGNKTTDKSPYELMIEHNTL